MTSSMDKTNCAQRLSNHFSQLLNGLPQVPERIEWLLPLLEEPETGRVFRAFLDKYYGDCHLRTLILGINPGRFGAGLTNVAFTDPVHLETECDIPNSFPKRMELSAQFIYKVVNAFGGPEIFYRKFFINSVVPFGFVKDGKNYNYYDDKNLQEIMEPFAVNHIRGLLKAGMSDGKCLCLGEGKNFKFLDRINLQYGLFSEIVPLPHPRFIMQYRRKSVQNYVDLYLEKLRTDG